MNRRVVVTGIGIVSPLGNRIEDVHRALCDGQVGIMPVDAFESVQIESPVAGVISNFQPSDFIGTRGLRPLNRTAQLLTVAAKLAIDDSGWTDVALAESHVGLVSGTVFSSARTISQFDIRSVTEGPSKASPLDFSNTVINAATGQAAIWHKLNGLNTTVAAGTASSLKAILYAFDAIKNGAATALLAGGVEELCIETFLAFHRASLTSNASNTPCHVPFQTDRNGFCLGEGAALLMLEDMEFAEARGVPILAKIEGGASGFDCQPTNLPSAKEASGRSAALTMKAALRDSRVFPDEVDAVSCAANGDAWYDRAEAEGLAHVFNGKTESLPVTAIKSMIGETLGAGGAMQAASIVASLHDGILPGIAGLDELESHLPVRSATSETTSVNINHALVNSIGFDGNHCSLVVGKV